MHFSLLLCLNTFCFCSSRQDSATSIFKSDINSIVHSCYCQCSNTNTAFVFGGKSKHPILIMCICASVLKQTGIRSLHHYQLTVVCNYQDHQLYGLQWWGVCPIFLPVFKWQNCKGNLKLCVCFIHKKISRTLVLNA